MSEKLNVLLLNDSFPPAIDGVANTVVNYANILHENGHTVEVTTPSYPNVKDDYPYEIIRYPSVDTTKLVGYRAGVPFGIPFLSRFKDMGIDIIHTHCPVSSTYLARMIRDQIHAPVIFTYHTKFDIDIKNAVDNKLIQDVAIKFLVDNISACDEIWTVSHGAGENLKSLGYKGDYIVMPNGVDFEKYNATPEEIKATKAKYHLPEGVPVFLFVGRLMWYKGLRIILDALKIKAEHHQDFRMIFVGDGNEAPEVKEYANELMIGDKCLFTGAIHSRTDLRDVYSAADLFLFPSVYDTNGIVVREALACGLGSALIKNCCASEDMTDNHNAILIDENAQSLADMLIKYGDNTAFFHTIGENAQKEIYLSWKDSVQQATERYHYLLEKYQYDEHNYQKISDVFLNGFANMATGYNMIQQQKKKISDYFDRYL